MEKEANDDSTVADDTEALHIQGQEELKAHLSGIMSILMLRSLPFTLKIPPNESS